MKNLTDKLRNGKIPLIEIARLIFPDIEEGDVSFNNPEFYKDMLLIRVIGDRGGSGIEEFLFYENNQAKIKIFDNYWTSDNSTTRIEVVDFDPFKIKEMLDNLN